MIVVDNPYVDVTTYKHHHKLSSSGVNFTLDGVPPGKHIMTIWHPVFEPVEKEVEIEVEKDKVTEKLLFLKPPKQYVK
jgi:hypothetical protein